MSRQGIEIKLSKRDLVKIKCYLEYEEARVIRRCNILNALYLGYGIVEISDLLQVHRNTVRNVGLVYNESGLYSALYDEERSGRPIDFDDRERSRIIAMVCSDPPDGTYRWTLDLIVEEAQKRDLVEKSISREQVRIILQEHDLKPWQEKMWCIAKLDSEYISRMETILDIYEKPYNKDKPVVCMDEKPVALISDSRERIQPKSDGDVLKKDYEYVRNGSVNVFCAVEGKLGRYINKPTKSRNGDEFAKFIKQLSNKYSHVKKVILIMDNLSTHKKKSLVNYYGEQEGKKIWSKFEVYYTPKHGSWLNQAEIAIGMYSRQCLGDGRIGDFDNLKKQTKAWNKRANRKAIKIQWRFTKKKARKSFLYNTS